jgi:hypothetical protein
VREVSIHDVQAGERFEDRDHRIVRGDHPARTLVVHAVLERERDWYDWQTGRRVKLSEPYAQVRCIETGRRSEIKLERLLSRKYRRLPDA